MKTRTVLPSFALQRALLSAALVAFSPLIAAAAATAQPDRERELRFTPDAGVRVDSASNPAARVDESGKVILFYEDQARHRVRVATAADGMKFSEGVEPAGIRHPFNTKLPDGTWRRYSWDRQARAFTSASSKDGSHDTPDAGVRYTLHESDRGSMGI